MRESIIIKLLFSLLFAVMMALDRMIVHADPEIEIYTDITQNYIGPVSAIAVVVFICSFVGMLFLLTFLQRLLLKSDAGDPGADAANDRTDLRLLLLFTLILGACWSPYLLANIPGGVWFDNYHIYDTLWGRAPLENHQPILYTLLHAFVFQIVLVLLDKSMQVFVMTMTMIQYTVFAVGLAWFLCWLKRRQVSKVFFLVVLLFFCLFPLVPGYAISNWKDTLFSVFLLLFTVAIADAAVDGAIRFSDTKWLARFLVFGFLVCFFRNNGIFIILACAVFLVFRFRKEIFTRLRSKFTIALIVLIAVTLVIQVPVFNKIGFNNDRSMEMAGIPIQQISSIILTGGDVHEDELAFFDQIASPEIREAAFSPNGVSSMKRYIDENSIDFLRDNTGEFLRIWANIVARNPKQAIDAYLLTTLGFWNANRGSSHGYMQTTPVPGNEYHGITKRDLVLELTGFDLRSFLEPRYYFSSALFGWIALFCFVLVCIRKKYTLLLPFIPILALWGTVLIAAPLAYSLRYVYALVIFLPLAFYLAFGRFPAAPAEELSEQPDQLHPV